MPRSHAALATALAFALLPASGALAQEEDREPTPEETTQIEAALEADGFTSWEEIELDDGVWEVDDAVAADGQKFDLTLDNSYAITEREPD